MTFLLGSHVERDKPILGAALRGAQLVQINLSAPQTWRDPVLRGDEQELKDSELQIWVHSPYLLNPASINPEQRLKTRNAMMVQAKAAARVGAAGLVVHGGHPTGGGSVQDGINGWLEVLAGWESPTLICIENTAGGSAAVARDLGSLERLFTALTNAGHNLGYVLDTCHAHAGGMDQKDIISKTLSATGRIDLVHLNDSKDLPGSGRDRHQNLGQGLCSQDFLMDVLLNSGAPAVIETPGDPVLHKADIDWARSLANR